MSQLSRLLSLSSRLCSRRLLIAAPLRATAAIRQPTQRFAARIARVASTELRDRPNVEDGTHMREILRTLNEQVQRSGRVNVLTVDEAISRAEQLGNISGVEKQLLLRATGSFLKDASRSTREKLAERVWALTPKAKLDISHYNTLLHVKLENGSEFDPSSVLQELSDAQIVPNRVTYQRLVQRYCEMGDIPNATKIIEFMKSQNLAINEKVFHSLIVGHMRSGNPEGARNIFSVMESMDLKPTEETHTVLAVELAKAGDAQGALEILASHRLMDDQILRIVKTFALKDDLEAVETAMNSLSDATINYSHVNSVCIELVVAMKLDAAVLIFRRAQLKSLRKDGANFLVITAAKFDYSASEILELCETLKDGTEDDIFVQATRAVVNTGNKTRGEEFIRTMRELGFPIRAHYYLPFLCAAPDEAAVLSELQNMTSREVPNMELLIDFVCPRVKCENATEVHQRLTETGVPSEIVTSALGVYLLRRNRVRDFEKLLRDHDSPKLYTLAGLLGQALQKTGDLETALRVIGTLTERSDPRHDCVSRFLENSGSYVNEAIEALSKTNLPLGEKSFNRLKGQGINVDALSKNVIDISDHMRTESSDANPEERLEVLEALLVESEAAKRDTTRLLRILLNVYCKQGSTEKIQEILRKLPTDELNAANLSNLVDFFTREKATERANYFFEQAYQRNFNINPYRTIALAKLLVQDKKLFEASELLEKASSGLSLNLESFQIERSAGYLLLAIYQNYGKDACLNFFERYISKHADARTMGFILLDRLDENPIEAFEFFKEIAYKYKSLACRKHICKKLIEQDKAEELEVMKSIITDLAGEVDCAVDMARAYLECGRLNEAKEHLMRCANRRGKAVLSKLCNFYTDEGQDASRNTLLELLEDLGIHKDLVSLHRMKQYSKENNVAAALEVWTQAQDDNNILPSSSLEILAELLERNGEPIPFTVPEKPSDFALTPRREDSALQRLIAEDFEGALEYREKLKAENRQLKDFDAGILLHALVDKDRLQEAFEVARDIENLTRLGDRPKLRRAVSKLFSTAAQKGMIEDLEAFQEHAGSMAAAAVQRAYFHAGRLEEYVTRLEEQPLSDIHFYISKEILDEQPQIGERLEKLAYRMANERDNFVYLADLWYLRIINAETEKAVQLQSQYPRIFEWLHRRRIPSLFRKYLSRDFYDRLAQITENEEVRSNALVGVVQALVENNNIDEAKSCLEFARALGVDCSRFPERLLDKLNQDVGHESSDAASESQSPSEEVAARSA